ncbi:DUF2059 domain-containing protein [Pseudoxanthomonas sp. Root630]|uniref:DUF2059 domain-containing protein n=1 Tax=Pseudoxanthomonas sp. Root630 TaxID=1736574 RepID=UPI000703BF24|nr:DUF2059 domain-containing protein [Pseudoxanthomonas sp. Root630]KRA40093.1 hypothetical protein ASD72_16835 [Pseudoxanthomonas sp. Root630]
MKKWMLCLLFAVASPVFGANPAPASEASVRALLEVTKTREMLDQVYDQVDTMYADSMRQAFGGTLTADQQARVDRLSTRMMALMKQELSWDVLAPMYMDIYRKSFSEGEVQEMLAFYRTPGGQAVINKMPLVMQHTMQAMQERMGALMPAMQQLLAEELKDANLRPEAPASHGGH